MGEAKYMVGWPAGRPDFSKKRAAGGSAGLIRAALCFRNLPAGWPANHVFGFTHPFWDYIIGICVLLDVFSMSWVVFSLLWVVFSVLWVVFSLL